MNDESMTIKILAILNLIISVQALFLSFHFILKSRGFRLLNRLLAFLCFSFAIISLNTFLNLVGIYPQNPLIEDISNNLMWFISPVLYLYVIYNEEKPENLFIYLNIFPFIIFAAIDILFDWKWFTEIIPFVAFTQMSAYMFLSIKYCIDNYAKARHYYNWILPSIIVFTILILINFSLSILETLDIKIVSNDVLQSFTSLLVIPIFYLAYKEMNSTNDFGIMPRKYQNSHISEEKSKEYLAKIEAAMRDDKLYLQKDLTLKSFSQYIKVNPKYISQIINQNLNMSFSDYVFRFRFDDVKRRLADSKNKNLTIFGIAQESGFKSNSTGLLPPLDTSNSFSNISF